MLFIVKSITSVHSSWYTLKANQSITIIIITRVRVATRITRSYRMNMNLTWILRITMFLKDRIRYLGICSAISSKLSDGLTGVFSNSRDGANVRWPAPSLLLRKTLAPRRCRCRCCSADFFRLFSCSRCKLCSRKKNIDILRIDERTIDVCCDAGELIMSSLSLYILRFSLYILAILCCRVCVSMNVFRV